jgi:hypothetical protein
MSRRDIRIVLSVVLLSAAGANVLNGTGPRPAAAQEAAQGAARGLEVADRALLQAAAEGDGELARFALERGADPEVRDPSGDGALHIAARRGSREVAVILLEAGAAIEARDLENGRPALAERARRATGARRGARGQGRKGRPHRPHGRGAARQSGRR